MDILKKILRYIPSLQLPARNEAHDEAHDEADPYLRDINTTILERFFTPNFASRKEDTMEVDDEYGGKKGAADDEPKEKPNAKGQRLGR